MNHGRILNRLLINRAQASGRTWSVVAGAVYGILLASSGWASPVGPAPRTAPEADLRPKAVRTRGVDATLAKVVEFERWETQGLWSVDDQATRTLMVRFYENLWRKKLSTLAALREAHLWMLTDGETRGLVRRDQEPPPAASGRRAPYYWAAFVLSGGWR